MKLSAKGEKANQLRDLGNEQDRRRFPGSLVAALLQPAGERG